MGGQQQQGGWSRWWRGNSKANGAGNVTVWGSQTAWEGSNKWRGGAAGGEAGAGGAGIALAPGRVVDDTHDSMAAHTPRPTCTPEQQRRKVPAQVTLGQRDFH